MIVLDTDHLTVFLRPRGNEHSRLLERLEASGDEVACTVISVEEHMRGWLAQIKRQKKPRAQIPYYAHLQRMFDHFANWNILSWGEEAANTFEELRRQKVRVGTMDLKIASIVLANEAVLLSRNLRDFQKVPDLQVQNWLD